MATTKRAKAKKTTKKKAKTAEEQKYKNCRIVTDLLDANDDAVQSWRTFRIMSEFVQGFELLRRHGLAASIFGGARYATGDDTYKEAEDLGAMLAKSGFAIITGGGPGVMEAANVGAFKVGGQSVGLNIKLPMEQKLNPYVTDTETFHFFFSRKVMLSFASEVYIYFPGGFGTMDEFFELVTLIQTKKISRIPIVLVDKAYWTPLIEWFKQTMLRDYKTIHKEDLDIFHLVDTPQEAYEYIMETVDTNGNNKQV